MNILLIISDTMRRDHLGCYGNPWIRTPNTDRLAQSAFVFDNAYTGNFPTVPNRCDVMTGQFTFIDFDWSPLPPGKKNMAEVLGPAGFTTFFCVDTPHIMQHGYNFARGFDAFEWIRGQENDHYRCSPDDPPMPCDPTKLRDGTGTMTQYLQNVALRRKEEDYFPAQTFRTAGDWIEERTAPAPRGGAARPWFVYTDTFDPHEPFDPPQHYADLYDPGYVGEEVKYPRYAKSDFLSPAELEHVRALYAGEVTLVDTWVGHLLGRVEALGLWDETLIIFTTDHGFLHGEHGIMGKALIHEGGFSWCQLYEEIAHIPLVIKMPGQTRGRRVKGYAQPCDLLPTMLDAAKLEPASHMHGSSLLPLMEGTKRQNRKLAVTTPSLAHDPNAGRPTTITMGDWSLIYFGNPDAEADRGTTAAVDSVDRLLTAFASGRIPAPELYNLKDDPGQTTNLIAERPDIARRLHRGHVEFLEDLGLEDKYLQHRRAL